MPRVLDLSHKPHATLGSSGTKTKHGVSCVAPVQGNSTNLRFASGGYDKRVYLWTVADDGSSPVSTSVPIAHSSFVQALVYQPSDHCLMSGAGSRLHRTNLRHIHPSKDFRLSNVLHHIHIHPQEPNLTILEVGVL
jgi:WD40 repeat protein